MTVAVFLLFLMGQNQLFYLDEWALVLERREWSLDALLRSHNEHLFLIPVLALKIPLQLVGMAPHWVFQVPLTVAHLVTVVLVFVLVSRRVGEWLGLAASLVILFLGSAWEDLLLPIQISFVGSVAAGLGMLLLFEGPPNRRRDALCAASLAISIASSGIGLSFAAVAVVETLASPRRWQRMWIVAAPVAAYVLWWAIYGERELQAGGSLYTNAPWVPAYVADEAAGAFGALSGLGLEWGRLLAILGAVLLIRRLLGDRVPLRLLSLLAGLATFWIATALARAHLHDPAATRYLYVGAVYVVLIAAEVWRPLHVSRQVVAIAVLGLAFVLVANLALLRGGRDTLREFSDEISARLAALELAGPKAVAPDFRPAPELAWRLVASRYFAAVEEYGSPAANIDSVTSLSRAARRAADNVLVRTLVRTERHGVTNGAAHDLEIDRVAGGAAATDRTCLELRPVATEAVLDVTVSSDGLYVRNKGDDPARVAVRRFGTDFTQPIVGVAPSSAVVIILPRRGSDVRWRARVEAEDPIEVC